MSWTSRILAMTGALSLSIGTLAAAQRPDPVALAAIRAEETRRENELYQQKKELLYSFYPCIHQSLLIMSYRMYLYSSGVSLFQMPDL